jgi:hypothetical protein
MPIESVASVTSPHGAAQIPVPDNRSVFDQVEKIKARPLLLFFFLIISASSTAAAAWQREVH